MNLLVPGGAGYIGSHFVKKALDSGHRVVVADNLQTGHAAAIDPRARFVPGDIRNRAFLADLFSQEAFDAVVHFAASSLVGVSMKEPLPYFDNNVHGMVVLLDTMHRFGVGRIVFSSSAAVYGAQRTMPITEESPTVPTNPYGETKLMMERIMQWSDSAYGMRHVSLRYFNVAGADEGHEIGEDHRPETHLIPIVLQVPLGLRPYVTIFGNDYDTPDGTCIRDYIHVDDLVAAHLAALRHLENGERSEIFNLGSNVGFTNLEVVAAARHVTGHPIPIEFGPRRPGDPAALVASSRKAEEMLGWEARKSLEEMIGSAWEWHRRHPSGYPE